MLKIDSNQAIKMSRGDDVKFPLFLNKGTAAEPIRYTFSKDQGCEVHFYIFNYSDIKSNPWNSVYPYPYNYNYNNYAPIEIEPVLEKVFGDDGSIKTFINGEEQEDVIGADNINENGDMMIWLFHDDTKDIPKGSYVYQIKAKLIDSDYPPEVDQETGNIVYKYVVNTVTNKLPIYIIDDDYGGRDWE